MTMSGFGFNFNGADIAQAGTFMHELGHNHDRRHGGEALQRNCKPNYVSVLSYLFQVHGINGPAGLKVDFSGQVLSELKERRLADGPLSVLSGAGTSSQYPTRWYTPLTSSFVHNSLGTSPVTRHCDGSSTLPTDGPMVRIDAVVAGAGIDWLNDGDTTDSSLADQDINLRRRRGIAAERYRRPMALAG